MRKYIPLIFVLLTLAKCVQAQLSANSLYFDGTGDLVKIPNIPAYDFGFNPFTVEAWVRDDDPAGTMSTNLPILSHRTGTQHPDGFLLTILEGHLTVVHGSGAGMSIGGVDFRDNICHHVALIRPTPFSLQCYIDGIFAGSGTLDTVGFTADFFIGNSPDFMGIPYSFHGLIKEVRLWNSVRTQSQVQANMNSVLNGASNPNLIGYWRCNETTGQVVTDYSLNANHAVRGMTANIESTDPITSTGCPNCTPPSAAITPAGPTTLCSGGSVILNAVVAANRTYQWKKGANLIAGATLSSYTATTGGNYRVIVTNTVTGCSKTTNSATVVTLNALPAAAITPQGPTTFCAGGSVVLQANTGAGLTYKWKKGSNFISGATLANYTATTGGNYRVEVTNSNGCSKVSGLVAVSVPCREGEIISSANNLDFNVYPNPNSGEFIIKFSTKPTFPIKIELTDEMGKVVERFEANEETVVIEESNLAKGIYCLTARNKDGIVIKKISVVK